MPSSVALSVSEKDVVKTILEYLENRGFHIAQLALERETGVINGEFSDDVLFLRQLILDGQWDNALDFVQPLAEVADFDLRTFRYHITKYKYFELLCIKQEPGPLHDNDFTVEELVECLKDLEHICPSPEDFRQLCALLTLPKLSDHAEFRHWNPSSARVECFKKIYPMVGPILASISNQRKADSPILHASNDRLLQLACKGIFYEACVDFCQAQALGDKKAIEEGPQFSKVLSTRPKITSADLSLVSWVEVIGKETFVAPFQQKNLDFKMISLRKPKLEAQWAEQILATPIKPGGMFPHALVPNAKLKCAERMSQSFAAFPMSSSYAMGTSISLGLTPRVRPHVMSQSTAAGVGFSIQENPIHEAAMQQSQMIDNLFETSDLTKSSRPGGMHNQAPVTSSHFFPSGPHSFSQSMIQPPSSLPTASRRQLDEMSRRSQPRQTSLPPVPELSTPGGGISTGGDDSSSLANHNMTRSRLFQEFATRQNIRQPGTISNEFVTPPQPAAYRNNYEPLPEEYDPRIMPHQIYQNPPIPPQQFPIVSSQSTSCIPMAHNPSAMPPGQYKRPLSQPPQLSQPQPAASTVSRGMNVQFEAIAKYEDQQAIRAVAFHPSGRFFAIGTNSKQLLICRYPDIRKIPRRNGIPATPEVVLNRPKQHRGSVYCLGFNQTGELLATGSNDKSLRLMAFNAEQCRIGAEMELNMHDGTVRDVIFMEDVLVSGGAGNCGICATDCSTGQTVRNFTGHSAPILGLYTWGGSSFVSCSQDKTIRFWDLRVPNAINIVTPGQKTSNAPVTSVCVDPSGKLLVSGHEDASVMLYDVTGNRIVQQYRPHGDEVRTVRFSNAAYYLLSGSYDKRVVITDMRGDLTAPLMYIPVAEHNDKIIQCRWHPHDFTFLSTSADRSAVLWSLPPSPSFM